MMVVIDKQHLPFVSDSILRYHTALAAKHRRTLRHVYTQPVLAGESLSSIARTRGLKCTALRFET
jgi:hypothetical protein